MGWEIGKGKGKETDVSLTADSVGTYMWVGGLSVRANQTKPKTRRKVNEQMNAIAMRNKKNKK